MDYPYQQRRNSVAILLFMVGLLSQTQINIGGKLGISELCMVVCAPFVFLKNYMMFQRDKVLYFFWLILFWLGGAVFVDLYIHNYYRYMMRGIAVPITVFSSCVCLYVLLRKDLDNLKWFLLGTALSGVLSIFVFQQGVAGDLAAEHGIEAGIERVVGYKLFWVNQITAWLTLPIIGWYLRIPKIYSIFAFLVICVFDIVTGGRSAFLAAAFSFMLILIAGKEVKTMVFIKKHFFAMLVIMVAMGLGVKFVYKYAATGGYMGADEEAKYEQQTNQGAANILSILMSGRSEFFIGLMAALDKPVLGHGSVAMDERGYVADYMEKYGTLEDYKQIVEKRVKYGIRNIPAHSHIINYWMWHGVFALIFWIVVLYLTIKTLFSRMHLCPVWYGYFAVSIPIFIWDILFSPFGMRVSRAALFVTFLLVSKLERDRKRGMM